MLETTKACKFLEHFSIITVGNNKAPNFSWAKYQKEKIKRVLKNMLKTKNSSFTLR